MSPDIVTPLLNLGLPGIVIVGLAWWGLKRDRQYTEAQEKRIELGERAILAAERQTASNEALTELIKELMKERRDRP